MHKTYTEISDSLIPVAGIGASAGGLEALGQLVEALSPELGLAYLIVSHMDPRHESHLAEILATIPVEVAANQRLQPDHVYVIPPATEMNISGNSLQLAPRGTTSTEHCPLTFCLNRLRTSVPPKQSV